jgi:hypothetical protein
MSNPRPRLASQTARVKKVINNSEFLENLKLVILKISTVVSIKISKVSKIKSTWEEVDKSFHNKSSQITNSILAIEGRRKEKEIIIQKILKLIRSIIK